MFESDELKQFLEVNYKDFPAYESEKVTFDNFSASEIKKIIQKN